MSCFRGQRATLLLSSEARRTAPHAAHTKQARCWDYRTALPQASYAELTRNNPQVCALTHIYRDRKFGKAAAVPSRVVLVTFHHSIHSSFLIPPAPQKCVVARCTGRVNGSHLGDSCYTQQQKKLYKTKSRLAIVKKHPTIDIIQQAVVPRCQYTQLLSYVLLSTHGQYDLEKTTMLFPSISFSTNSTEFIDLHGTQTKPTTRVSPGTKAATWTKRAPSRL